LHLWLQAIFLRSSSKKGISSNQLHRTLGVTLKSAWFMSHRIREAMRAGDLSPMGGAGGIVEVDETYYGPKDDQTAPARREADGPRSASRKPPVYKRPIVSLVERGGNVRSFHVAQATKVNVAAIVTENVKAETALYTDQSNLYTEVGKTFADHQTTNHSQDEYVRYEDGKVIHSNTVENYFSVFKRGMKGIYQHCDEKHLHRYLAEFDFRYNNRVALGVGDVSRAANLLDGVVGKRLTYQTTSAR
jgi:transposase-like protein